jgi:serine/threonine protein kinase
MSQVFKGEWRMPVAIKKMRGTAQHKDLLEFVREGEMLRGLSHPCIVKLIGVYQVKLQYGQRARLFALPCSACQCYPRQFWFARS